MIQDEYFPEVSNWNRRDGNQTEARIEWVNTKTGDTLRLVETSGPFGRTKYGIEYCNPTIEGEDTWCLEETFALQAKAEEWARGVAEAHNERSYDRQARE